MSDTIAIKNDSTANTSSKIASAVNRRDVTRDLFSASIGSVFCCYTGQPFDTIKVRMQTNPSLYSGIFKTVNTTVSNEGVRALWKGAVPTAMGMILENAMAFGVNEFLKRAFPDPNKKTNERPDLLRPFLMGSVTGCCSATVLLPSEVIKAKTQVMVGTSQSSMDIIKSMFQKQGAKSFLTGFDAQLSRDAAFYAFFFGSYELCCYFFRTNVPSMPDEVNYFLSGGLAGMMGWTVAMPFDVPKTNVQSKWDTKVFGSYIPEFINIARTRGIGGFYHGLGPTLVRAFPANAALFLGVEMSKSAFDKFIWKP